MDPTIVRAIIAITAIVFGSLIILIPIAGLTARVALKPIVDAISRYREAAGGSREVAVLEQRLALMEQQIQTLEGSLQRLSERKDFDRQLASPTRSP